MTLIFDGHNLIPRIPGIDLADPDDEGKLIQLLQDYCRVRRKKGVVFFDRAPAGWAGVRQHGLIQAHFVREGTTADDAIMAHLKNLGKRAKNVTVISSDRQVQAASRAVHAQVMTSEAFAADWVQLAATETGLDPREQPLSEEDVNTWEQLFQSKHPPGGDDKYNK